MSKELLDEWIERGMTGRGEYAKFARELRQACGQARLRAELEVFQSAPKLWLEHGPGRETPNNPGWTAAVHATEAAPESTNALLDRELMATFQKLLDLLTPHPELRARAAEIIPLTPPRAA